MTAPVQIDIKGDDVLTKALTTFPEDDARHWDVQAFLFNLLAHKAQTKADDIRRKSPASPSIPKDPQE